MTNTNPSDILLSLIFRVLDYCNHKRFLSYGYISITWFSLIASYLLLALILVPLCRRLHGDSRAAKGVTIVTAGYLGILAAVLVSMLAIYTHIAQAAHPGPWYYYIDSSDDLAVHLLRLFWAYYTLEVVGMLLAAIIMVSALVHLRKGVGFLPPI